MVRALNDARAVQNCTFRVRIPLFHCHIGIPNNPEKRLNTQILKNIVINDYALQPIDEVKKAGVLTWR